MSESSKLIIALHFAPRPFYRYFECRPLFGLFAPVHKVQKPGGSHPPLPATPVSNPTPITSTPRRASLSKYGQLSRERSGSQDSISSVSSTASSASRSRVRLGVTSLSGSNQVYTCSNTSHQQQTTACIFFFFRT